jgi:hypothetical protein
MSLAAIAAASLPPQVYAHNPEHDLSLTASPTHFRPVASIGWVKPKIGTGLWTAPATSRTDSHSTDSAWLEWMRSEMDKDTSDYLLTEICPVPSARILLIDDQEHLAAIVDAFPSTPNGLAFLNRRYPDWAALAAAGWDAVYLTDRGQWSTRLPQSGPDLYGWDLESALWLRHAFTVGRTVPSRLASSEATS